MNLLIIIASISAIMSLNSHNVFSTQPIVASPTQYIIKSYLKKVDKEKLPAGNTTNLKKCYYLSWTLNLLKANNIIDLIKNDALNQTKYCIHPDDVCSFSILWSGSTLDEDYPDTLYSGCVDRKYILKENQPNWNNHYLDDDSNEYTFWVDDFCHFSLCNSFDLKNLPLAKKVLNTTIKDQKHHDALCPGYSNNHQRINMHTGYQDIHVLEGSNLLLFAHKAVLIYERYMDQPASSYNSTIWTLLPLKKYHNNSSLTLVSINKNGNVTKHHDTRHDLINNNKIFYYSVISMHICNFTKQDEGIFKHIDIFNDKASLVYAINITIKEAEKSTLLTPRIKATILPKIFKTNITAEKSTLLTPRIKATTLPSLMKIFKNNIKLANKTKKDNTKRDIIMGVGITLAGVIVIIVVIYKLYKKHTKNNHKLLENENEIISSFINAIDTAV